MLLLVWRQANVAAALDEFSLMCCASLGLARLLTASLARQKAYIICYSLWPLRSTPPQLLWPTCAPGVLPPGIGGDAFALYYSAKDKSVTAVMGNGHSPGNLTMEVPPSLV